MIKVFTVSEVGGHIANEDAFIVEQHPADPTCWICSLADGQGGRSGGGRAATIAVEAVAAFAKKQPSNLLVDGSIWNSFLAEADRIVAKDTIAGFTTLNGFCVSNERIVGSSNGDSAVALFNEKGECVELTRNQRKNPPIGSGFAATINFTAHLPDRWKVLAMSDGVWKYARWEQIIGSAKTLRGQKLVDTLLQSARLTRSGQLQDDFTLVLLQDDN